MANIFEYDSMGCSRRIVVQKKRFSANRRIARNATISIDRMNEAVAEELLLRVEAEVTCAKFRESYVRSEYVPETWWQAFKKQYFPLWLKKRFPVIERRIDIMKFEQYLLLPEVPPDDYRNEWEIRVADFWQNGPLPEIGPDR